MDRIHRVALPAAALIAGLSVWVSQGVVTVAEAGGPRLAFLPTDTSTFAVAVMTAALVYALARLAGSAAPAWLFLLPLLPWLPVSLPPALQVWDNALHGLVWFAVIWILARRWLLRLSASVPAPLYAAVLALAIFGISARAAAPSVPAGDEPHYLVITQSLLNDGDLQIENNHRLGQYQSYFGGRLAPDFLRRGRNGEIYSIHAPGLPAIVAPAFLIGGYVGVVALLVFAAAAGSGLMWQLTWLATRDRTAAWFGWAAVTLSATAIFHSFTVYPDGIGGALVLTGVWALLRAERDRQTGDSRLLPWLYHGAALALLPWLHTRFAVLAGCLGALVLLRLSTTREPAGKAVAFLAAPAISAMCWVGFFVAIYGTPDPSAPYGGAREFSAAFIPGGLAGLFFDQRFGLVANAPVLLWGPIGLVLMAMQRSRADPEAPGLRRLALELTFIAVPYLLTVANFAMWWGGWSAPARFAAPVLPVLAIPCAVAFASLRNRATRATMFGALVVTAFISYFLVFADGGRLAFNTREGYALWLERASRLTDLGPGAPVWFRGQEATFFADIAIWLAAMIAAWALCRWLEPSGWLRSHESLATAGALIFAAAGMTALTIVWARHGTDGAQADSSQLQFLRELASARSGVVLSLADGRVLPRGGAAALLRIDRRGRPGQQGGAGRNDRPLLALRAVPAGRYSLDITTTGGGWIMIGIGQDQFALVTEPLSRGAVTIPIDFPVGVRALVVRGDEDARRNVRSIVVRPQFVGSCPVLSCEYARRAVRYGTAAVYFLDDRSFPEPEAFWVGGAEQTSIVIADQGRTGVTLLVRNAPVHNQLTIEAGGWRDAVTLAPGEERTIRVPIAPGRGGTLVRLASASGFRPSEQEAGSRDDRFLGVWVRVEPDAQNLTSPPK